MQKEFHGVFPYLVSPLDSNGEVKGRVLQNLVNHLIETGIHGLTLFGSTGELPYLNQEQKTEILKIVLKTNNGRVPIIAGVSHFSTNEAVKQAKIFEKLGADGILVAINLYFPLSLDSIYNYFQTVAQNVSCPIVIYHNPDFLKNHFDIDLINRLSEIPNIRYIKYATSNANKILSILSNLDNKMKVFSASANNPLLVLMFGGVGWMAGPACIIPEECVKLYNMAQNSDWVNAIKIQKQILQINNLFKKFNLAACIKAGLDIQGFDVGDPVAPQLPLTIEQKKEIKQALKNIFIS